MRFARFCHQYYITEADLQSCHRSRIDASADGEPKGCGEDLAMTRVLAQPERHRRADGIFEYSICPNQKIAQIASQVPYESSLILPWINIMLDP
jgi:hypothetical protein